MRLQLPDNIKKFLLSEIKKHKEKQLILAVEDVLQLATKLQSASSFTLTKSNFEGYLLYFFPRTYLATSIIFDTLLQESEFTKNDISILDIGCGLGSATMAILNKIFYDGRRINIYLNDVSSEAVEKSAQYIKSLFPYDSISIQQIAGNILEKFNEFERWKMVYFDVILLTFSLSCIGDSLDILINFIKKLQKFLKREGKIILIEPADKNKSTTLMQIRDKLAENVISPCTHLEKCPMLMRGNWCHFRYQWSKPSFLQNIFYKLGADLPEIKFSYLVLSNKNDLIKEQSLNARIVTPIFDEKGRLRFKICSKKGISECIIFKRDLIGKINSEDPTVGCHQKRQIPLMQNLLLPLTDIDFNLKILD